MQFHVGGSATGGWHTNSSRCLKPGGEPSPGPFGALRGLPPAAFRGWSLGAGAGCAVPELQQGPGGQRLSPRARGGAQRFGRGGGVPRGRALGLEGSGILGDSRGGRGGVGRPTPATGGCGRGVGRLVPPAIGGGSKQFWDPILGFKVRHPF